MSFYKVRWKPLGDSIDEVSASIQKNINKCKHSQYYPDTYVENNAVSDLSICWNSLYKDVQGRATNTKFC